MAFLQGAAKEAVDEAAKVLVPALKEAIEPLIAKLPAAIADQLAGLELNVSIKVVRKGGSGCGSGSGSGGDGAA